MTAAKIRCRSEADLPEALRIVEASFAPAPEDILGRAIARLKLKVAGRRDGSPIDIEAETDMLVEELSHYPADVAVSVLRDWTDPSNPAGKWWPSWSELKDRLDRACSARRMLKYELLRLLRAAGRTGTPQIELLPESDAHRAAVVAKAMRDILGRNTVDNVRGSRTVYSGQRDDAGTDHAERLKAEAALEALRERTVNEKLSFSSSELIARHARKEDE